MVTDRRTGVVGNAIGSFWNGNVLIVYWSNLHSSELNPQLGLTDDYFMNKIVGQNKQSVNKAFGYLAQANALEKDTGIRIISRMLCKFVTE